MRTTKQRARAADLTMDTADDDLIGATLMIIYKKFMTSLATMKPWFAQFDLVTQSESETATVAVF